MAQYKKSGASLIELFIKSVLEAVCGSSKGGDGDCFAPWRIRIRLHGR